MGFNEFSEVINGRLAMVAIVGIVASYYFTGQIVPGFF